MWLSYDDYFKKIITVPQLQLQNDNVHTIVPPFILNIIARNSFGILDLLLDHAWLLKLTYASECEI